MKQLALATLVVCGVSFAASSLSSQKKDIESDIKRMNDDKKSLSQHCADLRSSIPEFNAANDATNADLRVKRGELQQANIMVDLAQGVVDTIRDGYSDTLGAIRTKKTQLKNLKGDYLKEMRAALEQKRKDLNSAIADKNAQERKTSDLDNFNSENEYNAAITEFYRLKDLVRGLQSEVGSLEAAVRAATPPTEATLKTEITALETEAKRAYDALNARLTDLSNFKANAKKIAGEIKDLEGKKGAFANFVLPEVCNHF